jgi:AraC-like DNA-binding protein
LRTVSVDPIPSFCATSASPHGVRQRAGRRRRSGRIRFLRSLPPPHARDAVDRVRELVELLLPLRRCTMPRVARALGVTKRTLHRLLAARQESFAAIVDDARAGLAERYLATDRYTISDVSDRLGFAASSAFSRWFRRRFGISPTAWREATIGSAIPT